MIGCHGVFPLDIETKSANYTYHVESMKFFRRLLSVATIFQRSYRSYYIHPFTCFRKKRKAWCRLSDISRCVADFRYKWKYVLLTICIDDKERLLLFVYHRELGESLKLYRLICSRVGVRKGSANTKRRNLL